MNITINLPKSYDFSTADECALRMAEATAALEPRLKAKVEHGSITQTAADDKLHLYRSITAVCDAILAALEETELNRATRAQIAEMAENLIPEGAAKPSETQPRQYLLCAECKFINEAHQFVDGSRCPVQTLRADFYACPECGSFDIKKGGTDHVE